MKKLLYFTFVFGFIAFLLPIYAVAQGLKPVSDEPLDSPLMQPNPVTVNPNFFDGFREASVQNPFLGDKPMVANRFTKDIKQAVDSVGGIEYDLITGIPEMLGWYLFDYDNEGKQTEELYIEYDTVNDVGVALYKQTYRYNTSGYLEEQYMYWPDASGVMVLYGKNTFAYDAHGNQTEEISYGWQPELELWNPYTKLVDEYSQDDLLLKNTRYNWDEVNHQWIGSRMVEYSYNAQLLLVLDLRSDWDDLTSAWVYYSKEETEYTPENNPLKEIYFSFDPVTEEWFYYSKNEYMYNDTGFRTQRIGSSWDNVTNHWINSMLYEYTYDEVNLVYQSIYSDWRADLNAWMPVEKDVNYYDAYYNPSVWIEFGYDPIAHDWIPEEKSVFHFNNDYTIDDLIFPSLFQDDFSLLTHMIEKVDAFLWDSELDDWAQDLTTAFHYIPINIVDIVEHDDLEIGVYPNPASDQITINIPGVSSQASFGIYDLQGKKLLEEKFTQTLTIPVADWNSGLYIYRVRTNQNLATGKVLIR